MIRLELTNEEAALIDAALSLFQQQMVSNIGAIKETMQIYGEDQEAKEILKGSIEVREDIDRMIERLDKAQSISVKKSNINRYKKFKKK